MSLMNYGFTKSKVDRKDGDDCQVMLEKMSRQEAQMVSTGGKSQAKASSKSPSKSPMKPDNKGKKNGKHTTPSKSLNQTSFKKVSPKSNKKVTPKRSPQESRTKSSLQDMEESPTLSSNNSLPYQRIKMIMKSCPDVDIVPQESLHVITRATELFVQHLALESLQGSTSSVLDYESLSHLVHSDNSLEFLKETIPKKITWAECQKIMEAKKAKDEDFI